MFEIHFTELSLSQPVKLLMLLRDLVQLSVGNVDVVLIIHLLKL